MRFRALGPLSVVGDEGAVRLRPAQRRLLAGLLLDAGTEASTERLIDRMWPGGSPATARNTLHAHMSSLRRAIPGIIQSGRDWYRLDIADDDFDVVTFTRLAATAEKSLAGGRPEEAHAAAEEALRLWRGDPYPELADVDAARAETARLTERCLTTNTVLCRALAARGRLSESIALLQRLTIEHPLNESFREELARSLYRAGRHADALRAVSDTRRYLGAELGVEPGHPLRELEDKILVHHPDLAGPRPQMTDLPHYRTSFVGRDTDISAVLDLVERHPLVSITGEPGIGKTRLSVEAGTRAQGLFPDGVVLIRLVGALSESDVVPTIVSAVGVADAVDDMAALRDHLSRRRSLFILDNCEHVLDAVRDFVGEDATPGGLHVLVTSRTTLGLSGEQVWRLRPLGIPRAGRPPLESASVRLLADRAAAHGDGFSMDSASAADLLRLCQRTAGIPLALELAARWVPALGLRETADLLLEPAPHHATPATPHHVSLAAAIEWSVDTLEPDERAAFQAASLFRGAFTLDGFWQVCASAGSRKDTARMVARLVDASLLSVEHVETEPVRYRMLEPLREHALAILDPHTLDSVRDRHAEWFLQRASTLARAVKGPEEAAALRETDLDVADYRAAMRHLIDSGRSGGAAAIATALGRYWFVRYLGTEAQRWLAEALAGDMDTDTRLGALTAAGWAAYGTAAYARAECHYEECLALARSVGDRRREGEALYGLARIHLTRTERNGGALLEEALIIFDEIGEELHAAECRLWLGLRAANAGRVREAFGWIDDSIAVLERHGHMGLVSVGRRYLSLAAWYDHDHAAARHHLDLAESVARSANDHRALAGARIQRGLVEGRWGDPASAATAIIDALAPIPDNQDIDSCLVAFGAFPVLIRTGHFQLADRLAAHLDRTYEEYGWVPLDDRIPVTVEFRAAIRKALGPTPTESAHPGSSTAEMMAALRDALTDIAGGCGDDATMLSDSTARPAAAPPR